MSNNVPFVDLRAQHEEVRVEIEAAIRDIINRSSFIGGSYVTTFEREFASYLGVGEVVAVANGTDALWLGLLAMGVGANEAVITVPNTFIATTEAITRLGAYPIFVDIDLQTSLIDINALRFFLDQKCVREDDGNVIYPKTGQRVIAVMPVHLYGLPVNMEALLAIAQEYGLFVIEDACQAHGARHLFNGEWRKAGTTGAAAGFSFYPGKNLGAMGDGGALATQDPELANKIRWLRDHGSSDKYVHVTPNGWNSRLDAIQAAVLSIKLKKLDEWNARRRAVADRYRQVLAGLPLELPSEPGYAEHIYHLYVIRVKDRKELQVKLSARGISTGLHYPIPLHLQEAYRYLGLPAGSFPNAEQSAATLISLPMHPALSLEQVEQVGKACAEILTKENLVKESLIYG